MNPTAPRRNPTASSLAQTGHDTVQIAIETSGLTGSLAVLRGETVLQDHKLDAGKRTAATLAPRLSETLQWCRQTGNQPQFVSIANGPGSFTGLRIGVTTAKSLAYALQLPIVAVDSLAAIAATIFADHPEADSLLVGVNAYRGQVFCGNFARGELFVALDAMRQLADVEDFRWMEDADRTIAVDAEQWRQILDQTPEDRRVAGDPAMFTSGGGLRLLDRDSADAVGVGLIAIRAAVMGDFRDAMELTPKYLRPSAAEEKADRIKPRSA